MITGRTPATTIEALRATLQRAVSCVMPAVLAVEPRAIETRFFTSGSVAGADRRQALTLTLRHTAALVRDAAGAPRGWRARTTGYMYTIDDAEGREILAYHWHPAGRSPETEPHLHIGAGAGAIRTELQKAHLATGLVTPTALVSLVIEYFYVRPRRPDWVDVLHRARQAFDMS